MYERHIKGIYSGIVAFISRTQFSRRDESSTDLQLLREANTHLVEAVKETEQLQENLKALDVLPRLTPEFMERIDGVLQNKPAGPVVW